MHGGANSKNINFRQKLHYTQSATMIKKFTSLYFSSDFVWIFACLFDNSFSKILSFKFYPKAVFFECIVATLGFHGPRVFFKFISSRRFVKSRWLWDLINIISSTYLDLWSNESSRQNLIEKPANFASCRLLYTTLQSTTVHIQNWLLGRQRVG